MRTRDKQTASRFGLLDRLLAFETALLALPELLFFQDIEMDLDGWYDGIRQVIIVPRYRIDAKGLQYFEERGRMIGRINEIAASFGLVRSGDRIEDYGEHLYIVYDCNAAWLPATRWKEDKATRAYLKENDGMLCKPAIMSAHELATAMTHCADFLTNPYTLELLRRTDRLEEYQRAATDQERQRAVDLAAGYFGIVFT